MTSPSDRQIPRRLFAVASLVLFGSLLAGTYSQTCLSSRQLSSNFFSATSWMSLATVYQAPGAANFDSINLPFLVTFGPSLMISLLTWFGGAFIVARVRRIPLFEALIIWGWYGWLWWCLLDAWEWIWLISGLVGLNSLSQFFSVIPQFWFAGCLAGWVTTWLTLVRHAKTVEGSDPPEQSSRWLWLACGIYIIVFTTMNWRLYFNLLVPHGDSAMYEEHLWNLLHGKGFRSYLDQGIFLGEHIQFVHLFLMPVYLIWPSHLLLEACSTTALALGAFPVYWMARRHSGSNRAAFALAVAYLLYSPMQFLDIEIDLKTFRPESFGIPLLLLTLDQIDRRNLIGALLGITACLTVKEDYAIIFGPLGVWVTLHGVMDALRPSTIPSPSTTAMKSDVSNERRTPWIRANIAIVLGFCLSLLSVGYLWFATRVAMPWFRSGVEVHYASYFSRFGKTPEEIVQTMIHNPFFVIQSVFTLETALYAVALLAPLALIPLLSPGRLAVGLPMFAILCLNELDGSRTPQHQFHAPLVAIVFWAMAAAFPRATLIYSWVTQRLFSANADRTVDTNVTLGRFVWLSALSTGLFFSLSPLGISFWDPGSSWNWQLLYGPSQRAARFSRVIPQIPSSARVASTDFVHPRFTHYARSYDYSAYQRKVSGEGRRIPEDTDYIVIDTQHRYSTIKRPEDVPEYRDQPDQWELIPDQTEGYFIVLKRRR